MSRVVLTPVQETDLPRLLEWINDRELVELSAPFKYVSPEEHRVWFEGVRSRKDMVLFAIRLAPDGPAVGTCQLRDIDSRHQSAELTIRIGDRSVWDQGLGSEALQELIRYGFEELGLNRIALHVFADNLRAQRAYEKVGFVREGLMREHSLVGGGRKDAVLMAVLRREWGKSKE